MARTQLSNTQILEGSLTGADLTDKIGIYDETQNYDIGDYSFWMTSRYKCLGPVLGGAGGDLSNSPDLSSDWIVSDIDGGYF